VIAAEFPARSKNNVKNRWHRLQRIRRRVEKPLQAAVDGEDRLTLRRVMQSGVKSRLTDLRPALPGT
jgi:hypothetical protein